MTRRLTVWAIFSFAFALIPFAFAAVGAELGDKNSNFRELIERGDALLIVVALVGDSLGRFVMIRRKELVDIVAIGWCIGIAIMTTFEFATITELIHSHRSPASDVVWTHTVFCLCLALILGIGAIIRSEE